MLVAPGAGGVAAAPRAARRAARRSSGGAQCAAPQRSAGAGAPQDPERDLRKFWFFRPRPAPDTRTRLLGELACLNERLAGRKPHEARQRVEWIQRRRRNWELIYEYVTKTDAAVTLSIIEAANAKARAARYSVCGVAS